MGDPVNVAARLEQAAAPGEVLIGEQTFRLVRDAVVAEPVDPLELKGKSEPVTAFRLMRVIPEPRGSSAGSMPRWWGGRASSACCAARSTGRSRTAPASSSRCSAWAASGSPGSSARSPMSLAERATVLRGRCLPYGDGITFCADRRGGDRGRAASSTPTRPRGPSEAARAARRRHRSRTGRRPGRAGDRRGRRGGPGGDALGRSEAARIDGSSPPGRVRDRRHPVGGADAPRADRVRRRLVRDAPILLACMARPELLEVRPAWGGGKLNATAIALEPLSTEECQALVANLLAIDDVATDVRERVAAAAEGHPLFAEEMLATLGRGRSPRPRGRAVGGGRRSLRRGRASDDLGAPGREARPPGRAGASGARASLRHRAGVLSGRGRRALSTADPGDAELASLMRKQFIRAERSDLPDVEALAFRHLLIRDAAYEAMPKASRAEMHERFADWLEAELGRADRRSSRRSSGTTWSGRTTSSPSSDPRMLARRDSPRAPPHICIRRDAERSIGETCRRRWACSSGRDPSCPRTTRRAWMS